MGYSMEGTPIENREERRMLSATCRVADEISMPITEEARSLVRRWMFNGRAPPPSAPFKRAIELYVYCARLRTNKGRNDWTTQENKLLATVQTICSDMIETKHAAAIMFAEEAVESLLCSLYAIVESR